MIVRFASVVLSLLCAEKVKRKESATLSRFCCSPGLDRSLTNAGRIHPARAGRGPGGRARGAQHRGKSADRDTQLTGTLITLREIILYIALNYRTIMVERISVNSKSYVTMYDDSIIPY